MADDVDIDKLETRPICADCVGETFLSEAIETHGTHGTCHYCSGEGQTFTIRQMADRVATMFDQHYERTDPNPTSFEYAMMNDKESPMEWTRHGELVSDILQDTAEIDEAPANDIHEVLRHDNASDPFDDDGSEDEFGDEAQYERKKLDDQNWQEEWNQFEHTLKTETRYFSEELQSHLARIFANVDTMKTETGSSVLIEAGPDANFTRQAFYRARWFESHSKLQSALLSPDAQLGPPSAAIAQNGRMNARGIAVFYGADEAATALAEVRPPVGADVAIVQFKLTRSVRLLDLKAFAAILERGSLYDPTYAPRRERAIFLERLVRRITMPVMPSDEALNYLPTQAIADFLASRRDPEIDGILFPSVQVPKTMNVVLFHKSARVGPIVYADGTKLSLDTGSFNGDEWEHELTVVEAVPAPKRKRKPRLPAPFDTIDFGSLPGVAWDLDPDPDKRPVTLEVVLASLEVRTVTGVTYGTSNEAVGRRRVIVKRRRGQPDF